MIMATIDYFLSFNEYLIKSLFYEFSFYVHYTIEFDCFEGTENFVLKVN